jgi:hypothetical protein
MTGSGVAKSNPRIPVVTPDKLPKLLATDPVLAVRAPGSRRLLLVFTTVKRHAGLSSLRKFYNYVAPHGVNVVFLADERNVGYLKGISSFGDFEQSLQALRGLMLRWKVNDVLTYGTSIGGYGAMLYGTYLHARRVLSMAGMASIAPEFDKRTASHRMVDGLREVEQTRDLDFSQVVANISRKPRFDCYYAIDHEDDVRQAAVLARLKNVVLHKLDWGGHAIVTRLEREGRFRPILDEFLALPGGLERLKYRLALWRELRKAA